MGVPSRVQEKGAVCINAELTGSANDLAYQLCKVQQQVSWIVAWPTFGSGKARGASNIGGLPDPSEAADEF